MATLTYPQRQLQRQASDLAIVARRNGQPDHGILVSGPRYQTAAALERRGLGTLRYQGPGNRGWYQARG